MELDDVAVFNRMRIILWEYRYTRRHHSGEPFDWSSLSALIERHFRNVTGRPVELLQNALATFVIGTPHPNKKKKAEGIRHYTMPEDDRLEAIILFLTDSSHDNSFAFCSREELFKTARMQAPVFLLSYLHFGGLPASHLKATHLKGAFQSEPKDGVETTLDILSASDHGHLVVDITRVFIETGKRERYTGWGAIGPEETINIYVQDVNIDKNLSYVLLGFDKELYFSNKGMTLILLESDYPVDAAITPASQAQICSDIQSQLRDKTIVLTRLHSHG
jgi:hypothetical protein